MRKAIKGYALLLLTISLIVYIYWVAFQLRNASYREGYGVGWQASSLDAMSKGL